MAEAHYLLVLRRQPASHKDSCHKRIPEWMRRTRRSKVMTSRIASSFAGSLLLIGVLAACTHNPTSEPSLTRAQIVGTWRGPLGSLIFSKDQTFQADSLRSLESVGLEGCTQVSGGGTWQFLSNHGVSGHRLDQYSRGDLIGVELNASLENCSFELTTWEVSSPVGLCYYADPDSPCITPVFRKVK
jgi:hypothetical protein